MPSIVDRMDAFQRAHRVVGFPLGVVYKYFDDQGPYLAAILTYYAFISIFPLLLIASSVLGFFLQGNRSLQEDLLNSALSQFPIVGTDLGRPGEMQGSASAVVIGSLAALYGVQGLGQAAQNMLNVAWAVPRNSRLNPVSSRLRSIVLLVLAGIAVLAVAALTTVVGNLGSFGFYSWLRWLSTAVSVAVTAVFMALMMRYTTSRQPSFRDCLPGAIVISLLWHGLQLLGGVYVQRVIAKASDMNGAFALVLGLLGLLFIASCMAVLGVEVNVVLSARLYPRALLTPFTDAVDLTEADMRAYDGYAKAQRHKGFQTVEVTFQEHSVDRDVAASAQAPEPAPGPERLPARERKREPRPSER
ncbi:MAG: rane protein [Nocardioidaceae bacterium]|nr:rane protein [Nocardioidaceae bacterium]